MLKHFDITIFGRVQGVGFRWATAGSAKKHDITGFVQNQSDGSLYIEAQGENANLEKFIAWCRKGPLWAKVERLEIHEGALKDFTTFFIK